MYGGPEAEGYAGKGRRQKQAGRVVKVGRRQVWA
jgi:hypothetical protein